MAVSTKQVSHDDTANHCRRHGRFRRRTQQGIGDTMGAGHDVPIRHQKADAACNRHRDAPCCRVAGACLAPPTACTAPSGHPTANLTGRCQWPRYLPIASAAISVAGTLHQYTTAGDEAVCYLSPARVGTLSSPDSFCHKTFANGIVSVQQSSIMIERAVRKMATSTLDIAPSPGEDRRTL